MTPTLESHMRTGTLTRVAFSKPALMVFLGTDIAIRG
jgi:hypothetical protein